MSASIGSRRVLTALLDWPERGAWTFDATLEGSEALSGSIDIEFFDRTLSGTIIRSRVDGGHTIIRVIGGAHRLGEIAAFRSYEGSIKLRDVVLACTFGESIVDSNLLERVIPRWQTFAWPKGEALSRVLEVCGPFLWRMDLQGRIVFVLDSETRTIDPKGVLLSYDVSAGQSVESVESVAYEPSDIVRGIRARRLRYLLEPNGFRVSIFDDKQASKPEYDAKVVASARLFEQHLDGSVDLIASDLFGVAKVPLAGLPGAKTLLPEGSELVLIHQDQDERKPIALAATREGGLKLGTLVLTGSNAGPAWVPTKLTFFSAGPLGDAEALAFIAINSIPPLTAFSVEISTDTVKVSS